MLTAMFFWVRFKLFDHSLEMIRNFLVSRGQHPERAIITWLLSNRPPPVCSCQRSRTTVKTYWFDLTPKIITHTSESAGFTENLPFVSGICAQNFPRITPFIY